MFLLPDLSGNSPYFNSPGVGLTPSAPSGCNISAAALFIRHTDIYANDYEYENSLGPLISKLANFSSKNAWARDDTLAFLVNWTSPIDDPDEEIEETTVYGREDAKALGGLVAGRYESLLSGSGDGFNVWTADADRDQVSFASLSSKKMRQWPDLNMQETAKAFVEGLGSVITSNISLVVVDEGENQTANTLTPHVRLRHSFSPIAATDVIFGQQESCDTFSSSAGSEEQSTNTKLSPSIAHSLLSTSKGTAPDDEPSVATPAAADEDAEGDPSPVLTESLPCVLTLITCTASPPAGRTPS